MFREINDNTIMTYKDAEEKYKGYLILMIRKGNKTGTVCAISDSNHSDRAKISELQIELYDKNIPTIQLNELGGTDATLITRKCEIL